jgi:hypothetical protein
VIVLPTFAATRYVQPLREGGSLPAVVDTDGGGLFVVKFRGAGQGAKALISELIVGLLARELGMPVPELALIDVNPVFGRAEPDPEIQEVLRASHGVNVGLRYLDGAFNYDGFAAGDFIDGEVAADVVWLDGLVTNPDRTHRNPNILIWQRTPWLIDHGAALYAHHAWANVDDEKTRTEFPLIRDHVLLAHARDIEAADARLAPRVTANLLDDVVAAVPDELLLDPTNKNEFTAGALARARYNEYLGARLASPRSFVAEAVRAKRLRAAEPIQRRSARR